MVQGIYIKIDNLAQLTKEMNAQPDVAVKALMAALKRTATRANKIVWEGVKPTYAVKQKDLTASRKTTRIRGAGRNVQAEIPYKGPVLSFGHFNFSPKEPKKGRRVNVTIMRGQRKAVPDAFVVSANGGVFVAKRKGKARLPIKGLRTLSVPQMILNQGVEPKISEELGDFLQKRLIHEWNYRIGK